MPWEIQHEQRVTQRRSVQQVLAIGKTDAQDNYLVPHTDLRRRSLLPLTIRHRYGAPPHVSVAAPRLPQAKPRFALKEIQTKDLVIAGPNRRDVSPARSPRHASSRRALRPPVEVLQSDCPVRASRADQIDAGCDGAVFQARNVAFGEVCLTSEIALRHAAKRRTRRNFSAKAATISS